MKAGSAEVLVSDLLGLSVSPGSRAGWGWVPPLCSWAPTGTSPFMDALTGQRDHHPCRRSSHGCDSRGRGSSSRTGETSLLTSGCASAAADRECLQVPDIVVRKQDGFTHILLSTKSSENNSLNPEVSAAAGPVAVSGPAGQAPAPLGTRPARPAPGRVQLGEQGGQGAPSPCLLPRAPSARGQGVGLPGITCEVCAPAPP